MISAADRERRRSCIGASDVPAILGESPWATAADVYYAKVEGVDQHETEAMALGTAIEPYILDRAERWLGTPLTRSVAFVTAPDGIIAPNLDAQISDGTPVEAKQVGLLSPWPTHAGQWGPDGSDEIPDHVLLQVQTQIYACGASVGFVAAMIAGRGFGMFRVERNDTLIGVIVERCTAFWTENVLKRVRPPHSLPSLDVARAIRRTPGKAIVVPAIAVQALHEAREAKREAEDVAEEAERALLGVMGDAEVATSEFGTATFTTSERKGYTVEPTTVRTLRIKPAKKELPSVE